VETIPAIQKLNAALKLPGTANVVVPTAPTARHHFIWTNFLSQGQPGLEK